MKQLALPLLLAGAVLSADAQPLRYPDSYRSAHTDTYFGTVVPDPYRWLEDDTSAAVAQWVERQNTLTFSYLEEIPFRPALRKRMEELLNYPRYSLPSRRGPWYTFSKNDGLQNQSVIYIQDGLTGTPRVLLDPNTLSADGTVKLSGLSFPKDGSRYAYGISRGGSDWQEFFVRTTADNAQLPDHIRWAKVTGASWFGNGFFYSRYEPPADTTLALTAKNENHRVFYHRIGTPQSADSLVFEDPAHPLRFHTVYATEDERFLILYVSDRGAGKDGNAVFACNLARGERSFRPVVPDFEHNVSVVDNLGDRLLLLTNHSAPRYRLVLADPDRPELGAWQNILPQQAEPLQSASTVGGKLIAVYLKDVSHRVFLYDTTGRREREITLPTLGTVGGFGGERTDSITFFAFTSFTFPSTAYRLNVRTGEVTLHRQPEVAFTPSDYETRQVFYAGKDGARVPMFIVHRKGIELNGRNPTLLYGYGGFNSSELPSFSTSRIALLEQGVVYAVANIRGGGEYGEEWHKAAVVLKRQTAFDDFIAAAEWLIANKWTSSEKLALWGISNGGLLVGAVVNQRPDLARVALPQVGVMDMLRYHLFTIGWNWKPDFGCSEDSVEFRYLLGYSPLHNLRKGVSYPATFITTADRDDRVVPAHSFKYAAALQYATAGPHPALIRIDTRSGHGASSTKKALDASADLFSFMLYNLGVEVGKTED